MWGMTLSGAGGERTVGRVPGQGLLPSRKGGCPGALAPGQPYLICAVPTEIGRSMGAARRRLAGIQTSS